MDHRRLGERRCRSPRSTAPSPEQLREKLCTRGHPALTQALRIDEPVRALQLAGECSGSESSPVKRPAPQ